MRKSYLPFLVFLLFVGVFKAHGQNGNAKDGPKAKPTLEAAYRAWHAGFSSKKAEEREKTLRSMMPTKKDMEYLFPKHAKKLWPLFEMEIDFLAKNTDKIAEEVTKGGELKSIKAIDIRKEKNPPTGYKRLLEMIPNDVAVFDIHVERAERSSGGGTYLFLDNRWIWIKDLEAHPEGLEKLK